MATAILPATKSSPAAEMYELPDADRRALRALADKPSGKIPRHILLKIERQRISFINSNGSEF